VKPLHDRDGGKNREALDQLLELVVLLNDDMTKSLGAEGLTVPRAHLVWLLHHGSSTQRRLADALRVTPRNITGLVDGLVASGHVKRETHPSDRRATLVSLTERGASTSSRMKRDHGELAELLFGAMTDRQFSAFVSGLALVTTRLREGLQTTGGEGG